MLLGKADKTHLSVMISSWADVLLPSTFWRGEKKKKTYRRSITVFDFLLFCWNL